MTPFPSTISNAELITFIDGWAALLEVGDYQAAYQYTAHDPEMQWTPELMREIIESYGDAEPGQRVTVVGMPADVQQRKEVDRWPINRSGGVGEIWYDLNINGQVSDLTAIFSLEPVMHYLGWAW
jgi:hypothetical protein